ncbi:MAG TPA: hypothetical protein VFU62_03530, partial [Hanamia sp.]|nr:hypothetical protein [Hanamia sp.]
SIAHSGHSDHFRHNIIAVLLLELEAVKLMQNQEMIYKGFFIRKNLFKNRLKQLPINTANQ